MRQAFNELAGMLQQDVLHIRFALGEGRYNVVDLLDLEETLVPMGWFAEVFATEVVLGIVEV